MVLAPPFLVGKSCVGVVLAPPFLAPQEDGQITTSEVSLHWMSLPQSQEAKQAKFGEQTIQILNEGPNVKKLVLAATEAKNAPKYVGENLVVPEEWSGDVFSVTRYDGDGKEITDGMLSFAFVHRSSCVVSSFGLGIRKVPFALCHRVSPTFVNNTKAPCAALFFTRENHTTNLQTFE